MFFIDDNIELLEYELSIIEYDEILLSLIFHGEFLY